MEPAFLAAQQERQSPLERQVTQVERLEHRRRAVFADQPMYQSRADRTVADQMPERGRGKGQAVAEFTPRRLQRFQGLFAAKDVSAEMANPGYTRQAPV